MSIRLIELQYRLNNYCWNKYYFISASIFILAQINESWKTNKLIGYLCTQQYYCLNMVCYYKQYQKTLKYSSIIMCRLKCIINNENILIQWF